MEYIYIILYYIYIILYILYYIYYIIYILIYHMYINKGLCFVYVDCPMKYIPTKRSSPPKGTSVAHRRSSMRG